MAGLNETPRAERLHIGIYGRRNNGKSSLINAITGQNISLVSDFAGTTTDPVYKSMELHGIGPVVFIDTAGFDDEGELGQMRVERTLDAVNKTDIAIVVLSDENIIDDKNNDVKLDIEIEKEWISKLKKTKVPYLVVVNKVDKISEEKLKVATEKISDELKIKPILTSAVDKKGIEFIREELIRLLPEEYSMRSITGKIVKDGDTVLLVMPQDIQAPKGRLILPQVQTIRDLLDNKCLVLCSTADNMEAMISKLVSPPDLIITDSQIFGEVYNKKPKESKLTSFSVLFADFKGDIEYYRESVKAIENLTENSRVLIAEACTHAPLEEDIGRVKIPNRLRKKIGEGLTFDIVAGRDFPKDLSKYDLIIHCGGCMFNRKYVLSRIEAAKEQKIPMTNYGVVMAYLAGIIDKIDF
ncbi:[FeFe] hydrogenase H-cluster maturation GTPase HydF [Peptoclostridium sp. AF21-18]|uniref:[FeFe] hydrogenase H-cluster maturation GTPase HydF n=1 Tax=Peptoclostridium sp. AF21-18 TaxID=2292243 RepID=UPI000E4CC381|nr:[FeFe] hydrogenase H-cluster maturation GTPase HydF [Peptoclostridium sp. AF21-18]RHQ98546.1 [FeFe] hydrogenase H-cluster maturation GTPase HydF [Peptoclostridium sp. AF21-18]